MKLIVGLGNPGKEYQRTRHNVGFDVIETIISNFQFPISKVDKKVNARVSKGELNNKRVIVAMPTTYMNESGVAVQSLLNFYKLTPNDLIIVHDDKDIPLGETRVQRDRGAAGHNGIKSIIEHLGTKDFMRIRVGVAPRENEIRDTADFVLSNFTKDEQKKLKEVIGHVVSELTAMVG